MTTITVDANTGVMCSDSHWSDGTEKGPMRKVWRVRGDLVGLAGNVSSFAATLDYLRGRCKGKPPPDAATALILSGRRARSWTAKDGMVDVPAQFAIGTGAVAARAAMMAGASAAAAVRIARELDPGTSGRTRVYRLGGAR